MKMEQIPKPAPAFALILALTAISASADICLDLQGPKPDMWFDCWNCPYQCHGDADCDGLVYIYELQLFSDLWKTGGLPIPYTDWWRYDPSLDFDRDFDIDDCDVGIMEDWLDPRNGPPPDCPGRPLELQPMEPNALVAGSTYTIEWTDVPSSCSSRYRLIYSIDNGENWVQMEPNEVSNTCSFDWTVPTVDSNQCLLHIEDIDSGVYPYNTVADTIDEPFAIYECPETLTGDLYEDCYINFRDLNVLGLNWHVEPNFQTLAALAEQWCGCGNPYDPACGY